ncbi:aspartate aminotransferase family protein [Thiomicrospira sp. R3]|uniref:aspartate aminotransferase family protein n=1 Tax=Thiomicrospira sp. R3 TaxID=3035472 RepID=UPI00259B4CCE|nr:aspartate aminotransferase family protein [Thiomicrospira sp. R3]WFE67909.1 aspartate aminotransferase family protein [Thiomicrospira sp. R3]
MSASLMNTYARLPVTFVEGEGATLYDEQGRAYLDAVSGIAVCSLGHAHPEIAHALCEQSKRLIHTSNLYHVVNQQALADELIRLSGMDKVFFSNSGAEANEGAIKIARKFGNDRGITQPEILVMENSFHGRTMATLSATGNKKVQEGFYPLVEGFVRVPFDDVEAVEQKIANQPNLVAIMVEPVQGEGGVYVPKTGYLKALRALCDQHNLLLMIDEIQTGVGRTGKWFAFQHEAILPDVLSLAKALGNGVPIGACLARGKAAEVLAPGNHGTTFGGNPLACAAGLAVIKTLEHHNYIDYVAKQGEYLLNEFKQRLAGIDQVKQVRGKGYMIGIQLDRPCGELVKLALNKNLLINVTRGDTIRLLPPFVMSHAQQEQLISGVCELINEFLTDI